MNATSKRAALLVTSIILLVSCASVHNGNFAQVDGPVKNSESRQTESGLVLSGIEVKALASKYITQIDFTFENKLGKWVHIKSVKLDFGSKEANDGVSFPVGADLDAWVTSMKQTEAIKEYNFNIAMASLGVIGAGAAATSGNSKTQSGAGLFALAGASAALTANSVRNQLNNVELAKLVPDSHLLSSNFVVPPVMHTKKWIVLYSEKPYQIPYLANVTLEITTSDNKIEKLKLPFRAGGMSGSAWQKDHPDSESSRWYAYLDKMKTEARHKSIEPDVDAIRKDYIKLLMTE